MVRPGQEPTADPPGPPHLYGVDVPAMSFHGLLQNRFWRRAGGGVAAPGVAD
jgi:hypothetical protein